MRILVKDGRTCSVRISKNFEIGFVPRKISTWTCTFDRSNFVQRPAISLTQRIAEASVCVTIVCTL